MKIGKFDGVLEGRLEPRLAQEEAGKAFYGGWSGPWKSGLLVRGSFFPPTVGLSALWQK